MQVESDELIEAVGADEAPLEYPVLPDEGHGFVKRGNRGPAQEAYVEFQDAFLGSAGL